jgi:hypothetical protein
MQKTDYCKAVSTIGRLVAVILCLHGIFKQLKNLLQSRNLCSKTPQFNATYEYTYGKPTTFPNFPSSTVMNKISDTKLVETVTEGSSFRNYHLNFNAFGGTMTSSTPAAGQVALRFIKIKQCPPKMSKDVTAL